MTNIERTYNMWFQVWNCEYLPLVMDRSKWNQEEENLKENDIIYFKLTDSKLSADWRFGRVEYTVTGRDGKVRSVGISYKTMIENGDKVFNEDIEWKDSMVERPVRAVVRLMNVEDTSLLEDMRKVQELVKGILENKSDGLEADDAMESPEIFEKSKPEHGSRDVKKVIIRRKSEVEKLLEDETKIAPEHMNRVNRRRKKNPHTVQNNVKMSGTKMVKNFANISQLFVTYTGHDDNQDTTAAAREVTESEVRVEGPLDIGASVQRHK